MKEAKTTQKYKRKTKDCYAIEGNCGYGWDIECYCEDSVDAKRQLRTYQDNVGYPVRIKKWREKIVQQEKKYDEHKRSRNQMRRTRIHQVTEIITTAGQAAAEDISK